MVAKAKPKPAPPYEFSSEMVSRIPGPAEAGNRDNAAASDSDKATAAAPSTPAGADARAEVAVEQKPQAGDDQQPATAVPSAMPANLQAASPTPSPASAKTVKRSHPRQASRHPERAAEKRQLALMVLRTIEYPDGRRVSHLLPYRGRRDALAFGPGE